MVITPDEAALQAEGTNTLDPKKRYDSAKAGFNQGIKLAEKVKNFFNNKKNTNSKHAVEFSLNWFPLINKFAFIFDDIG